MAANSTTFTLRLRTAGLDEAQKQTQIIRDNLEAAAAAGRQLGATGAVPAGGSASSRRVASSAAASPVGAGGVAASAAAGGIAGREVEDYNRARGAGGAAGGSARDFADQARGLGGLVRLYATVAANTFALTAAFGALSRAMDTTNMVKGLDQLGASSGVALGSLSKRLVSATDGAISLREAMEATTKAVSSGMNSTDVLRLGNVAKQASQALGVDMGDAISRLTRGITKLEPELLDELGIFTKLDPAVKQYAKSVNKSISELTDFERRQAFANAVLAEGEQKFSSIKIDANPYTKLSAAVRDTTQTILEFVNKVIAPVASFFSQSPTALITGIGALAAILVKQALPAIGEFKQGLEQTAERAGQLAQKKAQEAQQARQLINQRIIDEVELRADRELRAVENAESRIQQLQQGNLSRRSAAFRLLSRDLQDVTQQDLQRVERAATAMERRGRGAEAAAYREVVGAIRSQIAAEQDLVTTRQRLTQQVERDAQGWGTYGQSVRAGQRAQEAATRSAIISNAAHNASLIGVIASYRLLREEIARNNISGFSAALLTARGALAAIGGAVATAMNALNGFFMVIGLITAAVSIIDGVFSKASKEIAAFDDSVSRTEASTKNLTETFDAIYKTNPFSVQSLEAQANAMLELSSSVNDLAKNSEKALRALEDSGWDSFKNIIKSIVGSDLQSTFSKTLGEGLVAAVKGIDNKDISERLKEKLGGILNIKDVTNVKELEKALLGLKPTSGIVLELKNALKAASDQAGIVASKTREVITTFDASKEAFRELSKQFEVNDPITKWANTSITSLLSLNKSLDGTIYNSIGGLVKISEEIDKAPIFGSSSVEVAKLNTQLKEAQQLMIRGEQEAQNLEEALKKVQSGKVLFAAEEISGKANLSYNQAQQIVDAEIKRLEGEIVKARAVRKQAESSAEIAASKVKTSISTGLTESIDLVSKGLVAALSKGSTQVLQSLYSKIDIVPELAAKQFDLKVQELQNQANIIKSQQDLANRIGLLTAEVSVTNAREARDKAVETARSSGGGEKAFFAAGQVASTEKDLKVAEDKLKLLKQSATDPIGALDALKKKLDNNTEGVKSYSKEIVDSASKNTGFIKSLKDIADQEQLIKLIEKPIAQEAARQKYAKEALEVRNRANAATREQLQLELSLGKGNDLEIIQKQYLAQLDQTTIDFENKKLASQGKYNEALIYGNALVKLGQAADAEKVYQQADFNKQQADELAARENIQTMESARISTIDKVLKKNLELLDTSYKQEQAELGIKQAKEDTATKIRDIELQTAEQTGKYTDSYLASLKYESELAKIIEEEKRKEIALTSQYKLEQEIRFQTIVAELRKSGGEGTDLSAKLALEMSAASAKYNVDVQGIKAVTAAQKEQAAAIYKAKQEQDSFNAAVSALKGLESIFPAMGTAMSSLVGALKDAVVAQDQYNKSREDLAKQIKDEPDYNKKLELNKKLSKLENERAKDELSQNANLMGSAKKLFKEKTVAYKAFAAVEKALHIARIAMEFKELFTSLFVEKGKVAASVAGEAGQTAASGAGFLARAGLYVTEIFAKISSQLGVFGPPVAAAIVAAIGLSAFSKKSSAPPKGFSDEEQKSVQGTGETYRNGEKVTRAGALAEDPTARASSVSKSLELVSANTFENLEYSNKMLTALKNIEKNTKGLTSAMMRSIARTPGGVTLPEQIPQGELRGNYIGKGLATAGGAAAGIGIGMGASSLLAGVGGAPLIGGALGALGAGAATALGGLLLPGLGLLFAKPLGKLIGSIFGGQTTQTVETFGIVVKGTLGDIAEGTEGVIQEWANIKNVRKGGWFRRDRTTYSTMEQEAQDPVKDMIRGLFAGVTDALTSAGDVLGKDVSGFLSNYLVKDFKITSKDMKPEELAEAIKGEISIAFNAAAEAAFPEFADFALPFEEAGETIIRLARQMQVFDFAMMSIGGALSNTIDTQLAAMTKTETVLTRSRGQFGFGFGRVIETTITRPLTEAEIKLEKVKIVDSLIEGAGGMEKFQEKVNFFAENFLTEAERIAPVREAVTDQLEALGLGFIDSRKSFKDYLLAIDLTVPGNIALYNSLMELAPGIAAVYEATDDARKALSETEMSKKVQDQRIRMLELLGSEANLLEITNIKRKEELAELAKYPKEQADLLIANQKYIYALEDENAIKAKLIKARDLEAQALTKTITAMKSAIDTLKNYRQTLLSGEKSTLTPQQRYQQAQSDFDTLQSIITSSASTTEEKAAAAGKLPAAADKLLESSRTMNASGEKYAQDFDKVLQALNISESILVGQQTDAEKQLKELEKNTSFLGAIDQNTKTTAELSKTTAELLKEYFTARSATEEARSGSATGLSIQAATVGSTQVPVYLDAGQQSPQVITAPTTVAPTAAPVVDVQPLVDEIKVLTEEVIKLRLDQEQQTAQIITTNDQTTQTAAVFIAETNDDLVSNQNFKTRTEFSFK